MAKAPSKEELLKEHQTTGPSPTTGGAFVRQGGTLEEEKKPGPAESAASHAAPIAVSKKGS